MKIHELQTKRAELVKANHGIVETAEAEDRDLSAEDVSLIDANTAEIESLDVQIDEKKALNAVVESVKNQTLGDIQPASAIRNPLRQTQPRITNPKPRAEDDPKRGFDNEYDFLMSLITVETGGTPRGFRFEQRHQDSLDILAAAGSDEQSTFSNPFGGFLVPPGFLPTLLKVDPEMDPTMGRVTNIPMTSPSIKIPARKDKDHSGGTVTGGAKMRARAESDVVPSTRVEFEQIELRVHTLSGLAYVTEELITDSAVSIVPLLSQSFSEETTSKVFQEKLTGTGVGQLEGVIGVCPATIDVAKEGGQTADTIVYNNVLKMFARFKGRNGLWIANHNTLPQLATLEDTQGNAIFFMDARDGFPGRLLGLPLVFSEYAETLGDSGDIILGDWSTYLVGTMGTLQGAESIHLRFAENERAFRWNIRIAGKCWYRDPITPVNGDTLSPFVTLADRA